MKFSFVVPCYNIAAYLKDCLESILGQSYENWEMILVNDGSTDNTEDIIQSYVEKDSRIITFKQENQGVSVARNVAISKATGDYLLFLDSDDWYKDEQCLEKMAETLEKNNSEILVFRYQILQYPKDSYKKERLCYFGRMEGHVYTGMEYLRIVLSEAEVYPWYSWLYAFKRELWISKRIQFNKELWYLEDEDIIYRVVLNAKSVEVLNVPIYQYRQRESSVTHIVSKHVMLLWLKVCKKNIREVDALDIDLMLKKLLKNNFIHIFVEILKHINYLPPDDREEVFSLLKENRDLMNYAMTKKVILIKKLTRVFGLHITSWLLWYYSFYSRKRANECLKRCEKRRGESCSK